MHTCKSSLCACAAAAAAAVIVVNCAENKPFSEPIHPLQGHIDVFRIRLSFRSQCSHRRHLFALAKVGSCEWLSLFFGLPSLLRHVHGGKGLILAK